jgi:hypothetical protein
MNSGFKDRSSTLIDVFGIEGNAFYAVLMYHGEVIRLHLSCHL